MSAATHPDPQSAPVPDLHDLIRCRAEEIYFRNGRIPGRDLENWAQAEREIALELAEHALAEHALAEHAKAEPASAQPPHRSAVVVTVEGVKYVGEYDPASSDGYHPGEFAKGHPARVRFDGDKMFVTRPNGKELETRIVQRIG